MQPTRTTHRHPRRGMSIIEVLIPIAIVLGLLAAVGYSITSADARSTHEDIVSDIQRIDEQIRIHELKRGELPGTLADIYDNMPVPRDPWGVDYVMRSSKDSRGFDVISFGPGRTEGGGDDVRLSELSL